MSGSFVDVFQTVVKNILFETPVCKLPFISIFPDHQSAFHFDFYRSPFDISQRGGFRNSNDREHAHFQCFDLQNNGLNLMLKSTL